MITILIIIEIISLLFFVVPVFWRIVHPGNILGITICLVLLSVTVFHERFFGFVLQLWGSTAGKTAVIAVGTLFLSGIIYAATLSVFMTRAMCNKPQNPQAVIVLGCKVRGDKPSRMLRRRLDAAISYLKENEDVVCVVSGGKGDDEEISEAEAMQIYLVKNEIAPERIIQEDKSVNTCQNLEYSLKKLGIDSGEIVVVTDGFHQYRARYIAKGFGTKASAVNAEVDIKALSVTPAYWLREWLAITNEYIK